MRVVQLLPTLSYGDAIGNDTLALSRVIKENGYETGIFAEFIDRRLPSGTARPAGELSGLSNEDVLIYHASTGTDLNYQIEKMRGRKMMIYHNITPPSFFEAYDPSAAAAAEYGYSGISSLSDKIDYCLADSSYNKGELRRMGYTCPIDVRPILIPFEDYKKAPDESVMRKYCDGKKNILFVGRIAPNKKQEDIIRAFSCYKKLEPQSRLILAGSYNGMKLYKERLEKYAEMLGVADDVVFTGHVRFAEILAYYRVADAFVCLSEHEGFCVPLVEAMFFGVPVIALDTSAVGETLGGSGFLIDSNEPVFVSMVIDRVIRDEELRRSLVKGQKQRLADFSYDRIRRLFSDQLAGFISGKYLR